MCAFRYDFDCVAQTIQDILPATRSEKTSSTLYPEVIVYETQMMRWNRNDAYIEQMLQNGGAFSYINPALYPSSLAQLQIALHAYHVGKNDVPAADRSLSSAVFELLLIDPNDSLFHLQSPYRIDWRSHSFGDIYAAFRLDLISDQFISNSLNHASVLFAQYKMQQAILLAFTNAHALTASAYLEAFNLFAKLEIADEV